MRFTDDAKTYKIGDMVRVKSNLMVGDSYQSNSGGSEVFAVGMRKFKGKVMQVTGYDGMGYTLNNSFYTFTDEMLEDYNEDDDDLSDRDKLYINDVLRMSMIEGYKYMIDDALDNNMHIENPKNFNEIVNNYKKLL